MKLKPIKPLQDKHKQILENIDSMPDATMVRFPVIQQLIGVSRSTIHRMIKAEKLKPYKLSERTVTFNLGQVRAFLSSQIEANHD